MTWLLRSRYDLLLVLLVSSIVFVGLGSASLNDYDEGIHAQVAREIVQTRDWVTLHYGGAPRFEKPPIYNWTTALFFKWFGINEFWARAGSAFSGVLVALMTYLLGTMIYGRRVGLLAVVPLFAGYEFLRQARNGTTDVMLTVFMLAILIVYIRFSGRSSLAWYAFWLLFGLGFMVKFWAIVLVLIAVGINLVLEKNVQQTVRSWHFWGGILAALVIVLPWHLAMYQLYGQEFIDRYIVHNLWVRSSSALEGNIGNARYYFDRMAYDYAPWFLLLPVALAVELKRVLTKRDKSSTLLIFTACVFGIYSLFVSTKLFHYLTPLYPVLAIFNANAILQAYDDFRSTAFSGLVIAGLIATVVPSFRVVAAFGIMAALLVAGLLMVRFLLERKGFSIREDHPQPDGFGGAAENLFRPLVQMATLVGRKNLSKLVVVLVCLFFTMVGLSKSRFLYQSSESPVEQIARAAGTADALWDDTIIALAIGPDYDQAIVGPAAMFYSERPIRVAWVREELDLFTAQGPREIILGERYIDLLDDEYQVTALVRRSPYIYGIIERRSQARSLEE